MLVTISKPVLYGVVKGSLPGGGDLVSIMPIRVSPKVKEMGSFLG